MVPREVLPLATTDLSTSRATASTVSPGTTAIAAVGVEAAHEHGQVPVRPLLGGVEQLVAPLDGGSHRLVASRGEPRPAAQRAQSRLEISEDLRGRHDPDPRRGELDRERQTVESLTQLGDRRVRGGIRDELGFPLPRPLEEQPVPGLGSERVQSPDGLAAHPERFAAGCQDAQVGA